MQKITPNLWFAKEAEEAVKFYISIFPNSKIGKTSRYGKAGFEIHHMPEGAVMTVEFELEGQQFLALNGGPVFKFTPAVSFLVACKTKEEVDALWAKLAEGGKALMPLDKYPFSERYGWTQDKYGLSWQIMFMGDRPIHQKITPTLMFVGNVCGKAEEAMNVYTSIFDNANVSVNMRYGKGEEPDKEGTIKHASFSLEGQVFAAMDSAHDHKFTFNEAISFMVHVKDQEELDYYWDKLIEGGPVESQVCGWLKDKYGLSWQIVPTVMGKLMSGKNSDKVMTALLQMKKLDIAELEKAAKG